MSDPAHLIALRAARDWAAQHGHPQPDDRMLDAYGSPLLAAMMATLDLAGHAQARAQHLSDALAEVLRQFTESGHPGRPCLRTGWVSTERVQRWRSVLAVCSKAEVFEAAPAGGRAENA